MRAKQSDLSTSQPHWTTPRDNENTAPTQKRSPELSRYFSTDIVSGWTFPFTLHYVIHSRCIYTIKCAWSFFMFAPDWLICAVVDVEVNIVLFLQRWSMMSTSFRTISRWREPSAACFPELWTAKTWVILIFFFLFPPSFFFSHCLTSQGAVLL